MSPLARMRSFFENLFLLIPIMVSISSKIALTKEKYSFYLPENPVPSRHKTRFHVSDMFQLKETLLPLVELFAVLGSKRA